MLKSLERFWISVQELKVKNLQRLTTGRRENQDVKLCHSPDLPKLKFVRIREEYQEFGLHIPDMMLNDKIKQSDSYQMFLKYSTGQIPPKKSKAIKRTASRRVVKEKVAIFAVDNIIPDPDVALKLGKSISLTEAAEEEAARQVQATHARILTKSVPKPTRRRPLEEQEATDTMKALKESMKTSRRQSGTRGSCEGTGRIPGVLDEFTVISATSSERTGTKPGVPDEEKIDFEDDDEKKDDIDDDKHIDLEMTGDEETDDEVLQGEEQVNDDEDEEMTNVEVKDSRNGDAKISDVAKADAIKIEEIKDDAKKAELPPASSSLSRLEQNNLVTAGKAFASSSFGDQFLKLSSDTSLVSTVKDTTDAEINSLLDIKIQYEVPHIQSPSVLTLLVLVIFESSDLTPVTPPNRVTAE
ncbi:hypothetical protein Tco_0865844 [Tanacetum coccineum]